MTHLPWYRHLLIVLLLIGFSGRPTSAVELERFTINFRTESGYTRDIKKLIYSPDGKWLAVETSGAIELVDSTTGDVVNKIGLSSFDLAFSADNKKLLVINSYNRSHIDLQNFTLTEARFNLTDGYLGITFTEKNGKVLVSAISPESPVAKDTEIRVGDEVVAIRRTLEGYKQTVYGNAKQATQAIRGPAGIPVTLYVIPQGAFDEVSYTAMRVPADIRGNAMKFRPLPQPQLGDNLTITDRDGYFEFSEASTANPIQWFAPQEVKSRGRFALSPDQKRFAIISEQKRNEDQFAAEVFDIATGKRLALIPHLKDSYNALEFTDDGKELCVGTWDTVQVMDIESQKTVRSLKLGWNPADELDSSSKSSRSPRRLVNCMAVSRLGFVAVGNTLGDVNLWDLQSGDLLHTISTGKVEDSIECIAVSPQGDRIAFQLAGVLHLVRIKSPDDLRTE